TALSASCSCQGERVGGRPTLSQPQSAACFVSTSTYRGSTRLCATTQSSPGAPLAPAECCAPQPSSRTSSRRSARSYVPWRELSNTRRRFGKRRSRRCCEPANAEPAGQAIRQIRGPPEGGPLIGQSLDLVRRGR